MTTTNATWAQSILALAAAEGETMTKKDLYLLTPLKVVVAENPKKKGTMSYERFQGYFAPGIETIQDAFDAGLRQDDIRHDADKGFIVLGDAALPEPTETEEEFDARMMLLV
jgi:hypothetical protein